MGNIGMNTAVKNSIGTRAARVMAVLVLGLLIVGETSLSYAQTTRSYVIVDKQANSMDMGAQGQQEIETTTSTEIDVTKTGDRSYSIKITNIVIEGSPGGSMGIDALIGLESDVVLAADGSIESVTGMDENTGVAAMGGEAVFRERLQSLFLHGPGGDVSIGSEWSHETSMPLDQQGITVERNIDSSYECIGEEEIDGIAVWVIEVRAEIEMTGSGNAGGQQIDMEMSGESKGKIYVDKATGMVLSSEQEADIEGTIDLEAFSILMTVVVSNTVSSTTG